MAAFDELQAASELIVEPVIVGLYLVAVLVFRPFHDARKNVGLAIVLLVCFCSSISSVMRVYQHDEAAVALSWLVVSLLFLYLAATVFFAVKSLVFDRIIARIRRDSCVIFSFTNLFLCFCLLTAPLHRKQLACLARLYHGEAVRSSLFFNSFSQSAKLFVLLNIATVDLLPRTMSDSSRLTWTETAEMPQKLMSETPLSPSGVITFAREPINTDSFSFQDLKHVDSQMSLSKSGAVTTRSRGSRSALLPAETKELGES